MVRPPCRLPPPLKTEAATVSLLGNQGAFVFLGHHITRSADTSAASGVT